MIISKKNMTVTARKEVSVRGKELSSLRSMEWGAEVGAWDHYPAFLGGRVMMSK